MITFIKKCFAPVPSPVKEYVYSAMARTNDEQFATLSIEVTASNATVEELHKVLTATAYQMLADSARTK